MSVNLPVAREIFPVGREIFPIFSHDVRFLAEKRAIPELLGKIFHRHQVIHRIFTELVHRMASGVVEDFH